MEIRIDFYSKEEVSVQMDFTGRYPFPANDTGELFVFSCFTLRQFANLGQHDVAMVLAALLTKFGVKTTTQLAEGSFEFPDPLALRLLMGFSGVRIGVDYRILRKQIMPILPRLVDFRGEGKKSFIVTMPPFQLRTRGFGVFGRDLNYFAFHSVIALYGYLAKKHIGDEDFVGQLLKTGKCCGQLHITQGVPIGDQVALANSVLKEVGVLS
ncbi:MAG: hypothetical protein WBD79_22315 [Anaerolineae bacterium]